VPSSRALTTYVTDLNQYLQIRPEELLSARALAEFLLKATVGGETVHEDFMPGPLTEQADRINAYYQSVGAEEEEESIADTTSKFSKKELEELCPCPDTE